MLDRVPNARHHRLECDVLRMELLERTGKSAQAQILAQRLIGLRDLGVANRSACELTLGLLAWDEGKTGEAIEHLQRAISFAISAKDLRRTCWAQLRLVILLADWSGPGAAIQLLADVRANVTGVYYNAAAVIDADGRYLGKYRKHHIPHVAPGFWEKFYFRPGNLGYPVFETAAGRIGVYICYDRHFPEGARILGLNGAEIVLNPSATVAGLSEYLWKLEQPAHAVANGYFVGAINRVGVEDPWKIGEFYGQSYFCDPRGRLIAEGSRNRDEVVVADLNLDLIAEVRNTWQFFRDRRPETYGGITAL
jgi:predicted amidohydrolase